MAVKRRPRAGEAQLAFEALSIEGGLLSPEWLSKIAQLQAGTQSEADYRIPKGLNLRDEIGRYWRIAQAHWTDFKSSLDAKADPKTASDRFLPALLRDAFGFASLAAVPPVILSERTYPIGQAALGGRIPVVVAPADSGLDKLSPSFGDGNRRRSAFGLAQEFLNAQDGALWGIASDGSVLRIVRDNASLTRPAWIEADLQSIFTGERYADFAALWLLCHETRFGREDQLATECALEAWRNAGREEGTRAREQLRRGVEEALIALGQGFLSNAENQTLRGQLQDGTLPVKDYFNQLLRLVYRLIFLLTVEERGLLHPTGTPESAKTLYAQGYSLRRLRERSVKRSAHDRFADLWEAVKIVYRGLADGEPRLGLPALAGVFGKNQCPALDVAKLENRAFLLAIFKLAWLREDGSLSRVNWRDMGPEELGSVYESLLELVPQVTQDARQFAFATGGKTRGNERKTTGSYYTPDSLVQILLDSALEPVIADTIAKNPDDSMKALLGLSIVDPACGSGHFLLGAARRLAAHVARLQANGTPSAAEYRHALRQVVGRCIFGVDLNPLAIELCKVGLWMEAVEQGLPLTFLDSHIQHGNALLGTTPELMAKGIPDSAWDVIQGDDKKTASALKKRNRAEAGGQRTFEFGNPRQSDLEAQVVTLAVAELDAASDANVEALSKKEKRWDGILGSPEYRHQKFVADAWCSAFVWPKQPGESADAAPTNELWRQLRDGQGKVPALTTKTVGELANQYRFFHWHLQFAQVFAKGGFDVVLGNPPWEHVELKEEEWFAQRMPEIANASNAAARKRMITALQSDAPALHKEFVTTLRAIDGENHLARESGCYPLCARGRINTYALFAEHNRNVLGPRGRAGFVVPAGLVTDDTTKEFFVDLVERRLLSAVYHFENEEKLFPTVHHAFRFILIAIGAAPVADLAFFMRREGELADSSRHFTLTRADFETLNPNTRTCPTFRSRRDADINLAIYRRTGVLWREGEPNGNPWGLRFMQGVFNMASDSALFSTRAELEAAGWKLDGNHYVLDDKRALPLVEAKMVRHFDHRFGTYEGQAEAQANQGKLPELDDADHADPTKLTLPKYWVAESEVASRLDERWPHGWLLGWRDITGTEKQRTVIASLIPRVAVGHTTPLAFPSVDLCQTACLYACLCSFALDYAARQKVGGTHLTYIYLKQLPVLAPPVYAIDAAWSAGTPVREWILPRVHELTFTAWDLEPFARGVGYEGPPFRWDPERRFTLRAELDAAFFHLYGFSRDDVDYVMETFPIVRKNDEKAYGKYRTKYVILEIYDALAKAAQTGKPYTTPLDPLPAAPGASHGVFAPDGTPKDYAEALRMGLLFTLIRQSGHAGISQGMLSRALLWLQDAKHAVSWFQGPALADFVRVRDSDPLLTGRVVASQAIKLLDALGNEKVISRDTKGIVRLRAGGSIPAWLPQTPTLAKLASVMLGALERAERGAITASAVETTTDEKAKRA